MAKKFLYFQPEYVGKFKCDGSKCNARCCKGWVITIDKETFKQYSRLKSEGIVERMKFNSERKQQVVTLDKRGACPFLTENNLCSIQLKHGVEFLSVTCTTYPRVTKGLGDFFERTLTLTCPVAAELILFASEPMQFKFVEVPHRISIDKKIGVETPLKISQEKAELLRRIQIAMISILQERTLSINQRLIVLCFFVDKLEEITLSGINKLSPEKLIATYKSKDFWAEQVPLMTQSVLFDTDSFIRLMMQVFESFYGVKEGKLSPISRKIMDLVIKTLGIKTDENSQISISEIVANYKALADARKKFWTQYSTFLENFLINELFINLYPWRYDKLPSKDISIFLITYKVFELFMFSLTYQGFSSKHDLLKLVDWYTMYIDHNKEPKEKIFEYLKDKDDFFALMETLLEQ